MLLALQSDSRYSEFVKYVEQVPGLSAELEGAGHFTIFAPNNQALKTLGAEITDRLKDKEILAGNCYCTLGK
jgi:uncharacterized surface protein with fasciclin (FAS1) repeats